MAKRRSKGEGGVTQRSDGRWQGSYVEGYTDERKPVRRYIYAATKTQLVDRLRAERGRTQQVPAHKITVKEWLEIWMLERIRGRCRPGTHERYDSLIKGHMGGIETIRLQRLTSDDVHTLLQSKQSPNTRRAIFILLNAAFKYAVRRSKIQANPCDRVDKPEVRSEPVKPFSLTEAKAIIKAALTDRLGPMYILAITCGLRMSELFGLKAEDVNLDEGVLYVRRQLREVKEQGVVEAPIKSQAGYRVLALPNLAKTALAPLLEHPTHDYLFTTKTGEPLRKSNFTRMEFHKLLERAEMPKTNFHRLRHTAATLSVLAGADLSTVSDMLGHSSVTLTARVYVDVVSDSKKKAAQQMNDLLG